MSKSFKGDCPLRVKLCEVVILSKIIHDHEKRNIKFIEHFDVI